MKRRTIVALVVLAAAVVTAVASATTSVKPYVVAVGSEYEVDALFSVERQVPVLGGAGTVPHGRHSGRARRARERRTGHRRST